LLGPAPDLKVLPVEHDLGRIPTRIDTPDLPPSSAEKAMVVLSAIKIGAIGDLPAIETSLFLVH
jgi:hypothetical protein